MATPSSSATSPSPPLAYLSHNPVISSTRQNSSSSSQAILDNEQRQLAVRKFLARAEVSNVTRALRTRLSYASFKATHNVPHANFHELEAHPYSQMSTMAPSRSIPAKRKATGTYHSSNPSASGSGVTPSTIRRAGSTSMPPPTSSPRTHQPPINGVSGVSGDYDVGSKTPGQSLYSTLLSPLTPQARTIHNAMDPPVPAASRPMPSPRPRSPKHTPRSSVDASRTTSNKSRKVDPSPGSPNKRKAKRTSDKSKHRKRTSKDMAVDAEEDKDVDMKAAATLTSLLLHNRPSIASTSSPRSSVDGSEHGSVYHHTAQSSAPKSSGLITAHPSISSISSEVTARIQTPPPPQGTDRGESSSTPRPAAPTDSEAANLMLFLATSPSPARPANKESKDSAAYRALSGGSSALRDKGRVLFASNSEPSVPSDSPRHHLSSRSIDASYSSSVPSIPTSDAAATERAGPSIPSHPPSQLLPPPTLPSRATGSGSPSSQSPRATSALAPVDFNFSDFIHGSPSPLRGPATPAPKSNLGLRADVGRKLFEEEQMRQSLAHSSARRHDDPSLAAGIDLVQT